MTATTTASGHATLTQQFAAEYARRAVPGMLRAIRIIKWANKGILAIAVAASYLHQAHFLATLGAGIFAWLVPAAFDLAIVSMLTVTQTIGMAADAKRSALKLLVLVVTISAAVNAAAPGPLGLRIVFALVVGLVAGVETVAGKIRPDFTAIEHRETELTTVNRPGQPPADATTVPTWTPAAPPVTVTPAIADNGSLAGGLPEAPAHLLPVARFSSVQHEQSTGRRITADELAVRLNITTAVAAQLLTALNAGHPAPRVNGHIPSLTGGAR